MPEQAIRFCVSDGKGLRSASWKCWTPTGKEDVYLTCRELNGAIKASLHQSGSWHSAYDSTFFDNAVRHEDRTNAGRFVDRWHTPTPLAPGVLLAFRIVTPWGSVFTSQPDMPGVFSAPKPAKGCAIEFDLFIIEPTTYVSDWPGKNSMKTELVGSYTLPSGRSVWVIYWEIPMPKLPRLRGAPKYFQGSGPSDLTGDGLRALLFGDEPDGSKVIYDCRLSRKKDT